MLAMCGLDEQTYKGVTAFLQNVELEPTALVSGFTFFRKRCRYEDSSGNCEKYRKLGIEQSGVVVDKGMNSKVNIPEIIQNKDGYLSANNSVTAEVYRSISMNSFWLPKVRSPTRYCTVCHSLSRIGNYFMVLRTSFDALPIYTWN